jgi:hypothetical protein
VIVSAFGVTTMKTVPSGEANVEMFTPTHGCCGVGCDQIGRCDFITIPAAAD